MPEIVKTKTTTFKVLQVGIDFLTFNESYRRIRSNFKYKGFQCYACDKNFVDGEKISLVITNRGNKVICRSCAKKFSEELEGSQ